MVPKVLFISRADLERRSHDRRTLHLEVQPAEGSYSIVLYDVSRTGARLHTSAELAVGELLELRLPEGVVKLRIIWRKGKLFGAKFTEPVSKAWVSAALLVSPFEPTHPTHQKLLPETPRPSLNLPAVWERPLMAFTIIALSAMILLFLYALAALPIF